jgi:hypothetical protein
MVREGDRMEPKSRRGETLEYQEVLEVSLMTSVSSYSNSNPEVAKVVKVGSVRTPFPKPAYELPTAAIKQRRPGYSNVTAPYLEIFTFCLRRLTLQVVIC